MTTKSPLPIVQESSDIEIEFQLALVDKTIVEETPEGETLRFTMGDGTFLNRIEEMLVGLELGTTAKFTLGAERAFGLSDASNFQTMSLSEFPADMDLNPGHVIGFNTPTGEEIPGTVHDVDGDSVVIDFNHPLADATVVFTATIKAIHS
ncbi:MAG: FKBP-type peptidyl-prolyl cis-trans isomerase [Thiomicrorhabdus sp.]|jgi:FKBP-type peptidyl-prolyl cis-trans isomerase SlpA|nr:FKBP-type peptidyl-prolyl cis-trans isomerase [Thiomicrorhabdus sp.]